MFSPAPLLVPLRHAARQVAILASLAAVALTAYAHGDVTPQAVDTHELPALDEPWLATNPYRGNETATRIGTSAFNQNCARCHGLEAISGGIAPDLRRNGAVYMPPFEGIFNQEAMWAIKAYLESRREKPL
jgi:mono/diheme cytochrome c family protein